MFRTRITACCCLQAAVKHETCAVTQAHSARHLARLVLWCAAHKKSKVLDLGGVTIATFKNH